MSGTIRQVDSLGRIVIPIDLRRQHDMMVGDNVEITSTDDGILLKPYKEKCTFCHGDGRHVMFENRPVCIECLDKLRRLGLGTKAP